MVPFLNLQSFYKSVSNNKDLPVSEAGHCNVVKVEDLVIPYSKPLSYSRRSYYKVSLVYGKSKIHNPEQILEITEAALVFTNPTIPYHWEKVSKKQTGLICI